MATEEGSVLALISKRLRTHRKKVNRISELEELISQGKTLNKDQEEILRSKPIITALIDELVKLRLPPPPTPSTAVSEENNQKQKKACKEIAEEKSVTAKAHDIEEDGKIADDLNSDEASNDNTSSCNGSSQGIACSRKSRRKQNAKKRLTGVIVSPTSLAEVYAKKK